MDQWCNYPLLLYIYIYIFFFFFFLSVVHVIPSKFQQPTVGAKLEPPNDAAILTLTQFAKAERERESNGFQGTRLYHEVGHRSAGDFTGARRGTP